MEAPSRFEVAHCTVMQLTMRLNTPEVDAVNPH